MNWRLKARLQKLIALLPSSLSYDLYYCAQRYFGGLRNVNPVTRLRAGVGLMDLIRRQDHTIESKTFLEIGTGNSVDLPIALWLGGASRVITVDLNPYLKSQLVLADMAFMRNNQELVSDVFMSYSHHPTFQERFDRLVNGTQNMSLREVLDTLNIDYMAPADAAALALDTRSVDYHVSYTVLEHIPPAVLHGILLEGRRVLKPGGLFVHCIDMSDHFSHGDTSISAINFLRFSDIEWNRYSGNRYMYHNRLRVDDYANLIEKSELEILLMETKTDQRALAELVNGFPLHERFQTKTNELNATITAWIVARTALVQEPVARMAGVGLVKSWTHRPNGYQLTRDTID